MNDWFTDTFNPMFHVNLTFGINLMMQEIQLDFNQFWKPSSQTSAQTHRSNHLINLHTYTSGMEHTYLRLWEVKGGTTYSFVVSPKSFAKVHKNKVDQPLANWSWHPVGHDYLWTYALKHLPKLDLNSTHTCLTTKGSSHSKIFVTVILWRFFMY